MNPKVRSNLLHRGGKAMVETMTGITVGKVVDAIDKALTARAEAKKNEEYMKRNYGTKDRATETRRYRHRKANRERGVE